MELTLCLTLSRTGFGTWLISNILFCMIVSSGAYFLLLTGVLQLTAIAVWTFSRNFIELQIPFQSADEKGDVILSTHFGLDYFIVLVNGVFCVLLGLIILALDSCIPDEMCQFFGIDPLTIYDESLESIHT
jgi:dual oxidase maturation factor 1